MRRLTREGNEAEGVLPVTADVSFRSALATFNALKASGVETFPAIGMAAEAHPDDMIGLLQPMLKAMDERKFLPEVARACSRVADYAPELADETFQRWLIGKRFNEDAPIGNLPWLTAVPPMKVTGWLAFNRCANLRFISPQLEVGGNLDLSDCTALESIPRLVVGDGLNLKGCTGLKSLPEGLDVGSCLTLSYCSALRSLPEGMKLSALSIMNCPMWDGYIPWIERGGVIFYTDAHPDGISALDWWRLHPNGEQS
jgi:hypothetical protein